MHETQRQTRLLKLTHSILKGIVALKKSEKFLKRHDRSIHHYKRVIKHLGEEVSGRRWRGGAGGRSMRRARCRPSSLPPPPPPPQAGEIGAHIKATEEDFRAERVRMNHKLNVLKHKLDKAAGRLAKLTSHRARVAELTQKWRRFVLALRAVHDKYTGVKHDALIPHLRHHNKLAAPPTVEETLAKDLEGQQPEPRHGHKGEKRDIYGEFGSAKFAAAHLDDGVDGAAEGADGADAVEGADVAETAAASVQLSIMQQELEQQRAAVAAEMEGGAAALEASEAGAVAVGAAEGAAEGEAEGAAEAMDADAESEIKLGEEEAAAKSAEAEAAAANAL